MLCTFVIWRSAVAWFYDVWSFTFIKTAFYCVDGKCFQCFHGAIRGIWLFKIFVLKNRAKQEEKTFTITNGNIWALQLASNKASWAPCNNKHMDKHIFSLASAKVICKSMRKKVVYIFNYLLPFSPLKLW